MKTLLLIFLGYIVWSNDSLLYAQSEDMEYDQFTIRLNVDKLGVYEMDAIYYEDNIYLPMLDLFRKLEIFVTHSSQLDTISGFILNQKNNFSFNGYTNIISFRDKTKTLKSNEVVADLSDVYFPATVYKELFGMDMQFNFRELTVFLRSDIELPIIKQLRIKSMRANLKTLSGETQSDTVVSRKWHWARGLVYDWNLLATQNSDGVNSQQLRSSLGMELLGGELNWRSNIVHDSTFRFENSMVKWRYVNDRIPVVKQIEAGNMNVNLMGQTNSNFYGIKLTNAPYTFKKTFGTYFIQRTTNPGWDVELYVNGILVNFTTADMNGDFNFEIPLIYGNSAILLRYYGPWGQESSEEITLNIPFSFTAQNHVEYQTTTGFTGDTSRHIFNKSKVSYGLSRWATVSTGYEYFAGNALNKHIFSGSLNLALGRSTLFNYTYLHNSNHYVEIMFRNKKNVVINGKHRQYVKNQNIIQTANRAESELDINLPIWNRKLKVYLRNTNRVIFSQNDFSYLTESALSVFYKRVNTGVSVMTSRETVMSVNTSFYFKAKWTLMHKSLYNMSTKQMVSSNIQLQKRFSKLLYAETNFTYFYTTKNYQVGVSLFFDLKFMRSSVATTVKEKFISSSQSLAGSVHISHGPKAVYAGNSANVGRAGIDVLVYLDINHNNKKDANEPLVKNASVGINKGKQVLTDNDTVHRFLSLEPYSAYLVTVANNGFPYISWILEKSTWSITTSPNQIEKVFIPVKPMGEVEMNIEMSKAGKMIPASRLIVYIYDQSNKQVAKGITERDGTFTYLGLAPGNYQIRFDEKQLKGLSLSNGYVPQSFTIKMSEQGDYVDGISIQLAE